MNYVLREVYVRDRKSSPAVSHGFERKIPEKIAAEHPPFDPLSSPGTRGPDMRDAISTKDLLADVNMY